MPANTPNFRACKTRRQLSLVKHAGNPDEEERLGPMKIAHLDTGLVMRGGQRQLLALAEELRRRGHEQTIIAPEESSLAAAATEGRFPVFALPAHDPIRAFALVLLRDWLPGQKFRILHAHDGRAQTLSAITSWNLPVCRIASRRVLFEPRSHLLFRLQYSRTCHGVIAVSQGVRRLLVQEGVKDDRVEVISDGIVLPDNLTAGQQRARLRSQWAVSPEDVAIGFLGGLAPEKGLDLVVGAAEAVDAAAPAVKWIVGGEGLPDLQALNNAFGNLPKGRFVCAGTSPDPMQFFPGLDLYVMPSRAEGLGSSALLAMAYGIPVIAASVGGLPEIVNDGENGWLIRPAAVSELVLAVRQAVARCDRRVELGRRGREMAQDFTNAKMADRTEAFYDRLLKLGAGRS